MDNSAQPVICCTGHDLLVTEFETHCSRTLASEPILWRHSKHTSPYPVRISPYFTRFNPSAVSSPIKVLSSGRPIHLFGSRQPLLHVHIISNNHTQYTSGGVKQKLSSWLSHLHAANIDDWMIVMIDADTPSSGPRVWMKSDLFQKIKQDFNLSTTSRHLLRIPDRRSVDEKTFQEAWTTLLRSLRRVIVDICEATIKDYDAHLQLLEEALNTAGWDFFEYITRKEELVDIYLILKGYEDALHEYYSLDALLSKAIRTVFLQGQFEKLPRWLDYLKSLTLASCENKSVLSFFPTVDLSPDSSQTELMLERKADLFVIRSYFLSRELSLLIALNQCHEIPTRALHHISAALEESKLLQLCSHPEVEHTWAFLCPINCMAGMFQANKVSEKFSGLPQSITAVLAAAFGLGSKQANQSLSIQNFCSDNVKMAFFLDNVFLHTSETLNPVARPLANLAAGIHSSITLSSTQQDADTKLTASTQLVNLWLMALIQLASLGQHLGVFETAESGRSTRHAEALERIKSSVESCLSANKTNESAFNNSVHRHLPTLLSSRSVYTEIYNAMAQTAIGFFQLLGQSRKSIYLCAELADFMASTNNYQEAIDLYSVVLSIYLCEGWASLATKLYMQLALTLRSFSDQRNSPVLWASASPFEQSALIRYFDCCMALSCASQSNLTLAANSIQGSWTKSVKPPTRNSRDLTSNDYWWAQAESVQQFFPMDLAFDATFASSSPFAIDSIQLDGASDEGSQLITVKLAVTSARYYVVRINVTGVLPSQGDWHTIMNYGVKDDGDQLPSIQLPNMTSVDLRQAASLPIADDEYGIRRRISARFTQPNPSLAYTLYPDTPGADHHLTPPQPPRPRRRGSFLDVAAAVATRAAWKSTDHLAPYESTTATTTTSMSETVQSSKPGSYVRQERSLSSSAPTFPLTPSPLDHNRIDARRVCSLSGSGHIDNFYATSQTTTSRQHSLCSLNADTTDCFLKANNNSWGKASGMLFTLTAPSDVIILKPGVNSVRLVATCPGFLLPSELQLEVLDRIKECNENAVTSAKRDKQTLKLLYQIQPNHFSSSWRCRKLLDSLLPKICSSEAANGKCIPVNVVLGLRQMVPLELQLGRLGLSVDSHFNVQLYCIVSNSESTGFSPLSANRPAGARRLKLVNDYVISPTSASVADATRSSEHQIDSSLVLNHQDGPISLVDCDQNESEKWNVDSSKSASSFIRPGSRIKLMRPLWLTSTADTNEFAIAMPSGYLYRLPVRVIRPLALHLNVQTLAKMDIVLFAIRIACMDIPPHSESSLKPTTETVPLTFKLSNFELVVVAPTSRRKSASTSSFISRAGSVVSLQGASGPQSKSKDVLEMQPGPDTGAKPNQIVGVPVNPKLTEAYVNRLSPITLLWRFTFTEFNPFVNHTIEKFNEPPTAKFSCTFTSLEDPDWECQLTFSRRISPSKSQAMDRSSSVGNLFAKGRRERVAF